MCKLMTFTSLKNQSVKDLDKLTKIVSKAMYSTEKNGFGVTVNSDRGLFARRFLNPLDATVLGAIKNTAFLKPSKNQDGILGEKLKSVIFHGRTSTNSVSLINTHPIVKHGLWLSHNGVVEDSGPKYDMITSNDTEHMIERISDNTFESTISGYYATMHFENGQDSIQIVKDSVASLYCAEVVELEGYCIATTSSLIESTLKAMGWTHRGIESVQDNIAFQVEGLSSFNIRTITPKGRSTYSDSLSTLSLGRSLPSKYDSGETQDDRNEEYMYELDNLADHTWEYYYFDQKLSYLEFFKLEYEQRMDCLVIRSDGTICSPDENNGLLHEGNEFNEKFKQVY